MLRTGPLSSHPPESLRSEQRLPGFVELAYPMLPPLYLQSALIYDFLCSAAVRTSCNHTTLASLIFGSRVNTHSLGGSSWFLDLGYPEQRLLGWGRKGLPSWVPGSQGPREHHGACTKVDPCAVSPCLCWETDHGIIAALGYQQSCAWLPTESRPATGGFQCLGQQREWLEDVQIPFCLPVPLRQQHGNAGFLALRRLQLPAAGWASHWGRVQTGSLGPRLVAPVFFFSSCLLCSTPACSLT